MVRCEARRAEEVPLGCGEDLLERPQLPLPAALGAVSREKRLGYPPRQGLRPGNGRSSKTIPSRRKEKWAPHCTSMGSLGAAAPKRPFRPFGAAPKGPRARGRETSPGRHCQKDKVGAKSPGGPCPSPSSQSCLTPAPAYSSSSGTHSIRSPGWQSRSLQIASKLSRRIPVPPCRNRCKVLSEISLS